MIDTVRIQIPLTETQWTAIYSSTKDSDREQWAKYSMKTGELRLIRVNGLAATDQNSFHRDIKWDVSPSYSPGKSDLTVELSLPKLFYGDNVRLLHNSIAALKILRTLLNRAFGFKTARQLPQPLTWKVARADLCYTWRFPDQEHAQHFLNGLKSQRFPHKQPTIRPTSITFTSGPTATYSAKFYLKLPEFLAHDAKAMLKAKMHESEIRFREHLATGLLRFEVTLRQKWLKRSEIETIGDLLNPINQMIFDEDLFNALTPFFDPHRVGACILKHKIQEYENDPSVERTSSGEIVLHNGDYFSLPAGEYEHHGSPYRHPGGGFRMQIVDNPVENILTEMLEKMVGKDAQLAVADRVKQKLSETYRASTSSNLTAFWLFVQKFGSTEALESYGRRAYYYKKAQLKKAGVSLLEHRENTIILGKDFFNNFGLGIPSEHVGNRVDDDRDSQNVLNLNQYAERKSEKQSG